MKIEAGEFGGTTVMLVEGDQLDDVPESHQHLVSDEIRTAFINPYAHLKSIIDRCPFDEMTKWLRSLHSKGQWILEIHRSEYDESGKAGFLWFNAPVSGARIHPAIPGEFPDEVPKDFRTYYDLVDTVAWNGIGAAGSFYGASGQPPLSYWDFGPHGADIDPDETYVWGDSPCGDMLIWTMDGRGGWFNLPSHKVHILGTIADTINWVYSELIHRRTPGWNYDSW